MDLIPVYGIYQDSSALYVAAVTTSFMDVYPSCDLCRHGFRLCTKHKGDVTISFGILFCLR